MSVGSVFIPGDEEFAVICWDRGVYILDFVVQGECV